MFNSRYAAAVAAFITMREFDLFSPEAVEEALNTIQTLEQFTDTFLEPFVVTSLMENGEISVSMCPMSLHCHCNVQTRTLTTPAQPG